MTGSLQDGISVLWRRLDMPGHEAVRIYEGEEGWFLDGSCVFLYNGQPCRLEYLIECDTEWRTSFATIDGFVGDEVIAIEIEVDGDAWYLNGEEVPAVEGCIDIDLNFSPVTNLLPIKRSGLGVGDKATVRAAWLRFPSFDLEPLEQIYTRKSESVYNYQSSTGFEKDITVDKFDVVQEYRDFWIRES
jgi:hypothetical protein